MKNLLFIVLVFFVSSLYPQGVSILFDNSGSMKQFYSSQTLEDGKQAVIDLVFYGRIDTNRWNIESVNKDFASSIKNQKQIWNRGDLIYVHAFGEIADQNALPFFKQPPFLQVYTNKSDAISFVKNELFSRLNFGEKYTHFRIADLVALKLMAENMPQQRKKNYCYQLTISDFVADPVETLGNIEQDLENERIAFQTSSEALLILTHKKPTKAPKPLKVQLKKYEWTRPEGDSIVVKPPRLISPPNNHKYILSEKLKQIYFTWSQVINTSGYSIHIRQVKPPAKIGTFRTKTSRYNLNIKRIPGLKKSDQVEIEWYVVAEMTEQKAKLTSAKSRFSIENKSSSGIFCIVLILIIAGIIIFLIIKYGENMKKLMRKPRPPQPGNGKGKKGPEKPEPYDY
jgi:hypothetical protein